MDAISTKLLLKIQDVTKTPIEFRWVHLCYVDTEVYEEFCETLEPYENYDDEFNGILSRWCAEEFGINLKMNTQEDLNALKELIKNLYRERYPEVYRDSKTDRQGWIRIWVTQKMRKEIEAHGK